MSTPQGQFVWCELMTTDGPAALAFYRAVIGWTAQAAEPPNQHYTLLSAGPVPMGGLMQMPAEACAAGARPGWIGYIAVDNVDAMAARVVAAGGAVRHGPDNIPGIARFAVVADPQGAVVTLFKGLQDMPPPPPAAATPGRVGWHELYAADLEPAFAFYAGLFGWTKADAIDMGPMGVYQLFAHAGTAIGGMMKKPDTIPAPMWLYYVNVDEINAAVARVKDAGGQVLNGPMQVPGGSWIAQCLDPQGVMFAIVGPGQA